MVNNIIVLHTLLKLSFIVSGNFHGDQRGGFRGRGRGSQNPVIKGRPEFTFWFFFVYHEPDRRKRTWVAEEIWTYIDRLHVTHCKEL